ncbi:hypothetical protein CR983_03280 [Candidatus Saccharibacteria bacterium]|nr:MAG: hypothetical protein CR983_03280 [Candidatus Saccharibacteria bacterium]
MSLAARRLVRAIRPRWRLVLDEQFSGNSLDTSRWNITNWNNPATNNLAVWRASNIVVSDGLQILSKDEPYNGHDWTSGNVQTYAPFKWATGGQYFRAEIRCKCPLQRGFWPAPLWFRPVLDDGSTGVGEIDLYEGYAKQAPDFYISGTLHGDYTEVPHRKFEQRRLFSDLLNPDAEDWHIYVIEKIPGRIDMYCDELRFGTWLEGQSSYEWPADTFQLYFETPGVRWALRCTMQIGGPYAEPNPDANNDWSFAASTLFIDYIRVWDFNRA